MSKRAYVSPRRTAQAAATRARIIDAARELFFGQGFGATTVAQIAERAEVAVPTVYATVGGKHAVLKTLIDVTIAGDDEPVAIGDRERPMAIMRLTDPRVFLAEFADHSLDIVDRLAPLFRLLRDAAATEPDVAEQLATQRRGADADMAKLAKQLTKNGLFDRDWREVRDLLYLAISPDLYLLCTDDRGWDRARYQRWLVRMLQTSLVD